MVAPITLRVITPEKIVVDATAGIVRLPALDGSMGVLARHAPMVTALGTGVLSFTPVDADGSREGEEQVLFVSGGFAEVRENTVRVVTESSERATDIDLERAQAAEERARQIITERIPDLDLQRAQAALARAVLRLRIARRRGRGRSR